MKKEYKYWIIDSEMEDSDDISPLQSEIKSQAWQKLSKQVPIEEQKSDVNFEILEDEDGDAESQQPTYQIRPKLSEKFKPMNAKEIIHSVLYDQLSTRTFNEDDAYQWSKEIADIIKLKMKELKCKEYKFIVNVVMGEQRGAGVKMGTRCIWDAEADSYAYDNFVNRGRKSSSSL
ncbi:tctex1 domain-containing protein 2-like isoform X2 [Belonocnema kinseyi]|uniref:tctex1 domain-containing protein 2-like isoform X2 n=1 Tax=Belonocnema kinseyi TaxID=2817044 RepID=UPI00143CFB14|nr:tctex1 domain-containing protein 2-like isoform X2 [Belonocnema kinseyi]